MNIVVGPHAAALLVAALLCLAGCGGDTDPHFVESAKDYLAKGDAPAAIIQLRNAVRDNPDLAEPRYLMGLALRRVSDPVGAELQLRKALDLGYDRNVALPALAEALIDSGAYDKALRETEAQPIAPIGANATLVAIRGDALAARGHAEDARIEYEAALKQDRKNERAMLGLARLAASAGDTVAAERTLDEILAANAKSGGAWLQKAAIERARGHQAQALDAYARAVDAKPEDLNGHVGLISLLVSSGRLEDAARRLAAMGRIAPSAPATAYADAMVSYAASNKAHAREAIQAALKFLPDDNRVRLLGGIIEHDLGNYAMAQKLLTAVVKTAPDDRRGRQMLASTLSRMGKAEEAREALAPLLKAAKPDNLALLLAGDIAMQLRDPKQALVFYGKSTTLEPKRFEAWIGRARAHFALGTFNDGIADLASASRAAPTQATPDALAVEKLVEKGLIDRAQSVATALVERLPGNEQAHNALGIVANARGDKATARGEFERAIKISPRFTAAVKNLASLDLAAGNVDAAIATLRALVALDPGQPDAILLLVTALQRTGAPPREVLTVIDTAQREYVVSLPLFIAKAEYLLFRGDAKGALDAALAGQAAFPDEPPILQVLARAQQAAGESRQALASYAKLASMKPKSPLPLLGIASAHGAEKNWKDAREALLRAAQIAPDQLPVRAALARNGIDSGEFATARDDARAIRKKWPSRPEGYLLEAVALDGMQDAPAAQKALRDGLAATNAPGILGELYRRALADAKADEAEALITTWLATHKGDAQVMAVAGEVRQGRGEFADAARWFRRALEVRADDPGLLNNLAWALGKQGDATALQFARRAVALLPREPAILDTMGVLNVQFGNRDEGIRQLETAMARSPATPSIRINLARALVKAGKKSEARQQLDEAARLMPAGVNPAEIAEVRRTLQEGNGT